MKKKIRLETKLYLAIIFGGIFPIWSGIFLAYQKIVNIFISKGVPYADISSFEDWILPVLIAETGLCLIIFLLFLLSMKNGFQKIRKNLEEKIRHGSQSATFSETSGEFEEIETQVINIIKKIKEENKAASEKIKSQTKAITTNQHEMEAQQEALLNVLDDIAQEKKNVETEQKKLEVVIQSIGDGLFVLDENQKIIMINNATEGLSGFTKKEVLGKYFRDFFVFLSEKTKVPSHQFIENIFTQKTKDEGNDKKVLIRKDKTELPVAETAAPIKNKEGRVVGCVVIFRDVSREREINRMRSEFVSVASHQLRTPLTSLNWYLELLQTEHSENLTKGQKEYLENAYQETQRMTELVGQLLNVSRIETGQLKLTPETLEVQDLIDGIKKETKLFAQNKGIALVVEKKKLPSITGDKNLLHQVLHNLITNAIKYSPEKTKITIKSKEEEKNIVITIQDQGMGIPSDTQKRIFEKFFRAENALSKQTDGTGLGLYIAKMIVEAHKGKIWFESHLKKGTTFFISLPQKNMLKNK